MSSSDEFTDHEENTFRDKVLHSLKKRKLEREQQKEKELIDKYRRQVSKDRDYSSHKKLGKSPLVSSTSSFFSVSFNTV